MAFSARLPVIELYYCFDYMDSISETHVSKFLNSHDKRRANSFLRNEDKITFQCSHAFLNFKLCKLLNTSPEKLIFTYNQFGKPFIQSNKIYFNLSHSKNAWALAFFYEEIGLDIEEINDTLNFNDLIVECCSLREQRSIESSSNHEIFFTLWTRKEALTKAIGIGLNADLSKIDVIEDDINIENKSFYLKSFKLENFILSLASPSLCFIFKNQINKNNYLSWF